MRISDWSSDVCSSDLVFTSFTSGALGVQGQGTAAATPIMTHEGRAQMLEAQASATGTMARRSAASSFGDFGERSTFGTNRAFGSAGGIRSEEHTSELQSLMRISYAVFCLKKKKKVRERT